MYELVDRPISDLPLPERALLDTMRRWVHVMTVTGERPVGGDADVADALMALDRGSSADIVIQRPCFSTVEEDEAVILSLWRLVRADRIADARRAASTLVDEANAGAMVSAMMRCGTERLH